MNVSYVSGNSQYTSMTNGFWERMVVKRRSFFSPSASTIQLQLIVASLMPVDCNAG